MARKNPIDSVPAEFIAEQERRYREYLKSQEDPVPTFRIGREFGSASSAGERWTGHGWQYCRGQRFCRAERTKCERTGIATDDMFGGGNPRRRTDRQLTETCDAALVEPGAGAARSGG